MVRRARATGTCSHDQTAAAPAEESGWGQIKPILIMRVIRKIIIRKIIGCICSSSPPRCSGRLPGGDSGGCAGGAARSARPCSSRAKGWRSSSSSVLEVPLICPWHSRGRSLRLLAFTSQFLAWDHRVSRLYVSVCWFLNIQRAISFLKARQYRKVRTGVMQLRRTDVHSQHFCISLGAWTISCPDYLTTHIHWCFSLLFLLKTSSV